MTVVAAFPIVCTLAGLLGYLVATNPKAVEASRILFAAGLLVTIYVLSSHVLKV